VHIAGKVLRDSPPSLDTRYRHTREWSPRSFAHTRTYAWTRDGSVPFRGWAVDGPRRPSCLRWACHDDPHCTDERLGYLRTRRILEIPAASALAIVLDRCSSKRIDRVDFNRDTKWRDTRYDIVISRENIVISWNYCKYKRDKEDGNICIYGTNI